MLGAAANRVFRRAGFEVRRTDAPPRRTLALGLAQSRAAGLSPSTVIDVGAGCGTPPLIEAFPAAHHVLFEPLEEHRPVLQALADRIGSAEYFDVALDLMAGQRTLFVPHDLARASLRRERDLPASMVAPRDVPCMTLDSVASERSWRTPFLIKLDVQGAELDVLRGAARTLRHAAYVVTEVSLFDFYRGGPVFADCVAFMRRCGFEVYDVLDPQYRPHDGALGQADVAFVPVTSPLRSVRGFAHPAEDPE